MAHLKSVIVSEILESIKAIGDLGLLTAKAQIFLLNGNESDVSDVLKEKINMLR